jgi:hypothetical protein
MSNTLRIVTTLARIDESGMPEMGGIPQTQEEIATDSAAFHQATQIVGDTHAAIASGDVSDSAMCLIRNMDEVAVVSVGIVESAAFFPLFAIPPGETAKLPRLTALADTYLKSDVVGTPVVVSLYEIVEPS